MPGFYRKIPKRRHSAKTRNALFRPYGPNRLTLDMPVNKFCLMIAVMIGANRVNAPARTNTIYLPEIKFNEKVDRTHAECANIDLDFASKFRNCLNMKPEATFIDSSKSE